jgi:UDPglucose 6-dehydrogenase
LRIGVVGLGYVGLVTAAVLADKGYEVVGVDVDERKVEGLNCGRVPIYEPGLKELLTRSQGRLTFTTDYSRLSDVDVAFIAVSTPTVNGRISLDYVLSASRSLKVLGKDSVIAVKSTVIPGTARKVRELSGREVVSNPEFLKEGSAIRDTTNPDRIVIGGEAQWAMDLVEKVWSFTNSPVIRTTWEEAEMIKYASNSFLAVKISFINEIANLCERLNCDVNVVAKAMGLDPRISPHFLRAGLGYGGSCFPKDTKAFLSFSEDLGEPLRIVGAAIQVNEERPLRAVRMLEEVMGELRDRVVCILGLAFKPNTDDTRESVGLKIASLLKERGVRVIGYDPMARTESVEQVSTKEECIARAEGVIVATEWEEFKGIEDLLKEKYVVDGRRILDLSKLKRFRAVGYGRITEGRSP